MPEVMKLGILKFCYWFVNAFLNAFCKLLFSQNYEPSQIKKILVLRTGSIGDCVVSLPAIYSIRKYFPGASLHILTNGGKAGLVTMEQIIDPSYYDKCINYYGLGYKQLLQQVKKEKYDLFIQLPQNKTNLLREFRMLLFVKAASIKYAYGFKVNTIKWFLKFQNEKLPPEHEVQRLKEIVIDAGIPNQDFKFPLKRDAVSEANVREKLTQLNIADPSKNIAFVIGANRNNNKWPLQHFNQLATALTEKGYNILIIGGKDDIAAAEMLVKPGVYNFCGQVNLQGSLEILRNCKITVSNDTGPMHLSYAVGTKVVGIFSAWQMKNIWFPPKHLGVAITNYNVHCTLCYNEKCANNICMQQITSDHVYNSVEELMKVN